MALKQAKTHEMDMCNGSILPKIVVFFIPVMLSNMLQLVYNAADQLVVGKFAGSTYLAAVGSTASLTNLIICLLIGLSVGSSSVVARHFGANNQKSLFRSIHTSMALSIICGVVLGIIGMVFCKPLLKLMDTPESVIDLSALYMRICFAGLPAVAVFNFGAAILRALGDTKHPTIFITLSGIINVVLNFILVYFFKLHVAGVAIATVFSQIISAALTVICLTKTDGSYKLIIKEIKLYKAELNQIVTVGIPASIQSVSFSLSNVFIQSSINSFGEYAMAGATAASNADNIIYQAVNSLYHTSLAFCGQNYGAGKKDRILKSVGYCSSIVVVLGLTVGGLCYIFGEQLLGLFVSNKEAIAYGIERLKITCLPYFTCGLMEVSSGALRGIDKSAISMIISVIGACVLRVVWIYTVFPLNRTFSTLFLAYPATWILSSIALYIMLFHYLKKMPDTKTFSGE